jgi:hypothetical protein
MEYELAQQHIDDMLREADRRRLAKQAAAGNRPRPADAAGFRERIERLLSARLPLRPGTPRGATT